MTEHGQVEPRYMANPEEMHVVWTARCRQAGVPEAYLWKGVEDFEFGKDVPISAQALRTYIEAVNRGQERGLVLCGNPGTGKTLLSSIIVSALCLRRLMVWMAVWPELLRTLEECRRFDSERPASEVIAELKDLDLLVIDDLGVPVVCPPEREKAYLYEIIDARYRSSKPLIMACNLQHKELSGYLGDRCWDRVRERSALLAFSGKSRRAKRNGG